MTNPTPIALAEIKRIADVLAEACGDDERAFVCMIEGETNAFEALEGVHQSLSQDEELIEGITARMTALNARLDRVKSRKEAKRKAIGLILRAAGLKKAELVEATVSVRDGKPKLVIVDADAVPSEYTRTKTEPDKTAINKAFEGAEDLPNWLVKSDPVDTITIRSR